MLIENPARPDELRTRSGGACISIIGFIAAMIGPCVFYSHRLIPGSEIGLAGRIVIGSFFLTIGLFFLFLRSPCIFDRRRRVIIDEIRFLLLLRAKETPFDTFMEVEIRKEVRRSKNSTYTVYPVALKGMTARNIEVSRDYETSRRLGEMLALFMELPLIDYSTGAPVRREYDELNEPLAERLRRLGDVVELPAEPDNLTVGIDESSSRLRLDIPKGRENILAKLMLLILPFGLFSSIVFFKIANIFTKQGPPIFFVIAIAAFMLIPVAIVMIVILRRMPAPQVVTITPQECRIKVNRPLFGETHVLPTPEVEEVVIVNTDGLANQPLAVLVPGRGVLIRTDKKTVEVGAGLDDDVKAYLEARICRFLMEYC